MNHPINRIARGFLALLFVSLFTFSLSAQDDKELDRARKTLTKSAEVFTELMAISEKGIPPALLAKAEGLVIVPGLTKAGFVIAGRRGRGVAVVKDSEGLWSYPVVITLTGGSFGFQAGVQSTDLVLVFRNRQTLEKMRNGKFTIGGDASVAAGPVGRQAQAGTDLELQSEIYAYSRSRGLFAGISLDGSNLAVDEDANEEIYRQFNVQAPTIFAGNVVPFVPEIEALREILNQ